MAPHAPNDHSNHRAHHRHRFRDSFKHSVKVAADVAADETEHLKLDGSIIGHLIWVVVGFYFAALKFLLFNPGKFFRLIKKLSVTGWQEGVSSTICAILDWFAVPLSEFGKAIEGIGNKKLGQYKAANGIPHKRTIIGLFDTEAPALRKNTVDLFPSPTPGSRPNGDVCVTAAKIIYEKKEIVEDIINNVWNTKAVVNGKVQNLEHPLTGDKKFEFVQWFTQPDTAAKRPEGEREVDTEAMIFRKGPAIVVAFRGTQPFSAVDWATDFYFPWWELPAVGRVHTGFLHALGLGFPTELPPKGDAKNVSPDDKYLEKKKLDEFAKYMKRHVKARASAAAERATLTGDVSDEKRLKAQERKDARKAKNKEFDEKYGINATGNQPLYWQLRKKLQDMLDADDKAHVFITGHSLGGALAALFTGLLVAESDALTQRISGLFTFGQPRIGDWTFAWFLHSRLNGPQHRYVRMIYGYDLVPHVPFDSDLFEFKHLGPFHWVDPFYHVRIGTFEDQPSLNVFKAHLNGIVELWYNTWHNWFANRFLRAEEKQRPVEGLFQKLMRWSILSLPFLPMIGAHSPVNYVNAVRYGMPEGKVKLEPAPASG